MASAANEQTGSFHERLRSRLVLRAAFRHVERCAQRSASAAARQQMVYFAAQVDRHLERIATQLRQGRFIFAGCRGIAVDRPGKAPRPIVLSSIETRIVQRAILDVLLQIPEVLYQCAGTPTSFGGIAGRGVPGAVAGVLAAIRSGHVFFLRSDIAEFFRRMPRRQAMARIAPHVPDDRFLELIDQATATELENLAELGDHALLFPQDDIGVPQGCALSTLLGNALLQDFDTRMNGRGVICIRYVDDFILLAHKAAHVRKAFENAQRALESLGMRAYDPASDPGKAAFGHAGSGLEFLGCDIREGRAAPSRAKRDALLARVDMLLRRSEHFFNEPAPSHAARFGLGPTLQSLGCLLDGFRASYSFCDASDIFEKLDRTIEDRVEKYLRLHRKSLAAHPTARAALRGLCALSTGD